MSSIIKGSVNWFNQDGTKSSKTEDLPGKGVSMPTDDKFHAVNSLWSDTTKIIANSAQLYEASPSSELSTVMTLLDSAKRILNNMSNEIAYKLEEEYEGVPVTKKKKK
jgi:hypothetical protein